MWRGLNSNRMRISDSGCDKPTAHMDALPSKKVLRDAQKYIETFLKTKEYVSIFVRMEKALKSKEANVTYCLYETLQQWRKIVSATGLNSTFLSTDVGRLGSDSYKPKDEDSFSEFFNTLLGNQLTIKEWEATFETISSSSRSGYIAMLQKAIASGAKCVLFVGGGSFQRHALRLYRKRHADQDWCVHVVEKCTSESMF